MGTSKSMPFDDNRNDSSMAERLEKMTKERDELLRERDEIAAAADRNAAKFTKVARFNREYIEKNQSLLKEKKEWIIGRDDLMEKNAILVEQVKNANEVSHQVETEKREFSERLEKQKEEMLKANAALTKTRINNDD